ncbi:hypothetical protein RhiirA1_484469 [Rhizophagus irregularis]|uniref:Uncharacterized protein n=1 Tax=Rhizophagus irregularis TaxID=588596 RepID=A0A2I1FPH1_9GLOM|nr:hypothetical protein RhiirA1_484469 [Rhizophagus irregularis]PKY36248.1 hypothetical protein RhiirB3_458424 [Rhizophagus irregularis]
MIVVFTLSSCLNACGIPIANVAELTFSVTRLQLVFASTNKDYKQVVRCSGLHITMNRSDECFPYRKMMLEVWILMFGRRKTSSLNSLGRLGPGVVL